jgi:hypothetical protein
MIAINAQTLARDWSGAARFHVCAACGEVSYRSWLVYLCALVPLCNPCWNLASHTLCARLPPGYPTFGPHERILGDAENWTTSDNRRVLFVGPQRWVV